MAINKSKLRHRIVSTPGCRVILSRYTQKSEGTFLLSIPAHRPHYVYVSFGAGSTSILR